MAAKDINEMDTYRFILNLFHNVGKENLGHMFICANKKTTLLSVTAGAHRYGALSPPIVQICCISNSYCLIGEACGSTMW